MPKKASSPLTTVKRSRTTAYQTDFDKLKAEVLTDIKVSTHSHDITRLPIDRLHPGRYQPRTRGLDDPALNELAESIKELGVIEPLAVRPIVNQSGAYEILAGDRRWRAAQQAGLSELPVIVHDVDDRTAAAIALVENLQREDLNPIEEATGLQRLMDDFTLTQAQVGVLVSKSESAISKCLGLLKLPVPIQDMIQKSELEAGHGKVLLNMPHEDQLVLANKAVKLGWSVRALEKEKAAVAARKQTRKRKQQDHRDPNIKRLEINLSEWLSTPVTISPNRNGSGKIVITYLDLDNCESILQRFGFKHE